MTAIAIGSIFAVALLTVVWIVKNLPGGCYGDCRQGRDECDQPCKDADADRNRHN
jgi:hypothetical protein